MYIGYLKKCSQLCTTKLKMCIEYSKILCKTMGALKLDEMIGA